MSRTNGGDLLVRLMRDHGTDTAFGVVSVHNLPLVDAVSRELRFVPVRHEAAAVNAADGYSRATGRLGVAITSTGTGAGNAAGAMVEALTAGSRVLHVTGQIESEFLGQGRGVIHETRDQAGMLAAVSKRAGTITSAGVSEAVLRQAISSALTVPCGPCSVEWPIDLQYASHDVRPGAPEQGEPAPAVDAAQVRAAAEVIRAASKPLLWVGGGGTGAGERVRELAERLGAGVLTSNSGRGSVSEEHELVIGNFATNPEAAPLLAEADLLISIGTHFRSNETKHYSLELPAQHVQIDVDPAAIGRVHPATAGITGTAEDVLPALLAALPDASGDAGWRDRVASTRSAVRDHLRTGIGDYALICDAIREQLPSESVIARDVTIPSSQWGNRLLEIHRPETNVFPVGGGIGQGLASGIGAAIGSPDAPALVIAGDGGLVVHLGELATLAEQQPWLVLVVFNDGGYGVLRNMQDAHADRRSGVDLYTPHFGKLADAHDIPYALVNRAECFAETFAKAVADRGPYLIEVDVTALEPTPTPFVPPVHIPH